MTRTQQGRNNLLNRIFITRGQTTVYSPSAKLNKESIRPLPSHYNKNKHSFRMPQRISGAMLILYQTMALERNAWAEMLTLANAPETCKTPKETQPDKTNEY